jgi:hypothetical protein
VFHGVREAFTDHEVGSRLEILREAIDLNINLNFDWRSGGEFAKGNFEALVQARWPKPSGEFPQFVNGEANLVYGLIERPRRALDLPRCQLVLRVA